MARKMIWNASMSVSGEPTEVYSEDETRYANWLHDPANPTADDIDPSVVTNHALIALGLPTAGDTVVITFGTMNFPNQMDWAGITLYSITDTFTFYGALTLPATCTIPAIFFLQGESDDSNLICGARWLGDINISCAQVCLANGWLADGGNVNVMAAYLIDIRQPGAAQNATVNNMHLSCGGGTIDLSNTDMKITGTLDFGEINIIVRGELTLMSQTANAYGVGVGHLPNVANVLTTDNVLGAGGTFDESVRNTDPGQANVKIGTAYKIANAPLTGTLAASAGGRVIGG